MNNVHKLDFCFEDVKEIAIPKMKIRKWIQQILKAEESTFGFICIIFCSDNYLLDINKKYLNHDYYTDIITFEYYDNEILNADLFISLERVKENCKIFEQALLNEICRIIVHGILHVIGYDDKVEKEKELMKKKEDEYLNVFVNEFF